MESLADRIAAWLDDAPISLVDTDGISLLAEAEPMLRQQATAIVQAAHIMINLRAALKELAVLAMTAQSDPFAGAPAYRKALQDVTTTALRTLETV